MCSLVRRRSSFIIQIGVPPEEPIEDAADIGNGHAGSKHAGDFPGHSPNDIGDLARDVMQNPARTKPRGGGQRAYQGKGGSTIVIHDPMHPDGVLSSAEIRRRLTITGTG